MAINCLPTRVTTNFALCALVLLIISTCKGRELSSQEINSKFEKHRLIVRQFPCGPPQPRSINVQELLGDQLDTSESAQPHTTVLHRCDRGTGCCDKKSQECKVAEVEEIDLHFYVTDVIHRSKSQFREFKVHNHTRCSCQSMGNTIK